MRCCRRADRRAADVIFHLAAIVSGEAEADFEKGYRINLDGTRHLFEAIRAVGGGYKPRLVFASSIAVFGAPFPDTIGDEFLNTPLTSYGTQKAIGELLLADYSRRGMFDGIGIRLPTICVRPGKPNKAASGFFSNIMREPLAGAGSGAAGSEERAPLARLARARRSVSSCMPATLDPAKLGARRNLSMPGVSATVGEQIERSPRRRREGGGAASGASPIPPSSHRRGWPRNFDASGRCSSASRPKRASTTSSASTSRTSSAASSPREKRCP